MPQNDEVVAVQNMHQIVHVSFLAMAMLHWDMAVPEPLHDNVNRVRGTGAQPL